MANTRETLGDQATVDALVANTLTTLEEDGVVTLGNSALRNKTALTEVLFPSVNTVNTYAFGGCTNLEKIRLTGTGIKTIAANAFNGCSKLQHLVINSSSMSTLSATSAFTGTPIVRKDGAIYVPSSLISTYKANSNWKNYFIADINNYPLSSFESISDSWTTIVANSNYATDYAIGDTKEIDLGAQGTHLMVLVAKDTDVKADNTGNARMTWISNTLLTTSQKMNSTATTSGGWSSCALRTYLTDTIKPLIPEVVRNALVPVTKVSATYENSAIVPNGQTTTDDVWIPSAQEMFGGSSYETNGVVYTGYFTNNDSRIKYQGSSASYWWLRSANSATGFRNVGAGGGVSYDGAKGTYGVVLGFCI